MEKTLDVDALIEKIYKESTAYLKERGFGTPVMIGIYTGGVQVAKQLHQKMQLQDPLGTLDISFYRDDFTQAGLHPQVRPSDLPFEVEKRHVLLVDDVIQTGRTIRAAINEIFDYGRPESITLITLLERAGRELPIRADITGKTIHLEKNQRIKLNGSEPMSLEIKTVA